MLRRQQDIASSQTFPRKPEQMPIVQASTKGMPMIAVTSMIDRVAGDAGKHQPCGVLRPQPVQRHPGEQAAACVALRSIEALSGKEGEKAEN